MSTAEELKNQGNKLFTAGDYENAAAKFSEAIALDPKFHVAYSNRSGAYASMGKYAEALADAEQVIAINPTWPKGYTRKATALQYLGKTDDARAACQTGMSAVAAGDRAAIEAALKEIDDAAAADAAAAPPAENPMGKLFGEEVWGKLAGSEKTRAYLNQPDFVQMIRTIQSNPNALNMFIQDPRFQAALSVILGINFGGAAASGGPDVSAAAAAYDEEQAAAPMPAAAPAPAPAAKKAAAAASTPAAEPEPEDEEARKVWAAKRAAEEKKTQGNTHYTARQFEPALECYLAAQALDPANMTYKLNEAAVYMEREEYARCIETARAALEIGGGTFELRAKAFVRIGNAAMRMLDYDTAIAAYKSAQNEVRSADTLKRLSEAQRLKKKAAEDAYFSPELAAEAKTRGNEAFSAGDFPLAVKEYSEAIKRNPKDHVYYSNRAGAYTKLGALPDALKDIETCLGIEPRFVKAMLRRGNVEFLMKDYHKCLDTYEGVLEIEPGNEDATTMLGTLENAVRQREYSLQPESEEAAALRTRALNDVSIQQLYSNPTIQSTLQAMSSDPRAANEIMREDPTMLKKLMKLRYAGLIRFG